MALTKVRLPVADIGAISSGTTDVTILSVGGDIDINVAGVDALDITSTTATVGSALTLVSSNITTEDISLSTAGGASGELLTSLSSMTLQTTTAHPTIIGANSTTGLTVETDGKVTLGVVGTLAAQLVDKNYIDTQLATKIASADTTATLATTGEIVLPNSTGNDLIVKWGQSAGTGDRSITFGSAFPNAVFTAFAAPTNTGSPNSDGWWSIDSLSTTGFTFNVANKGSYAGVVYWMVIGY